jgi:His/Glu/Gln/Arg/opine family amino acid ABC transporter permease subunit
VLEPFVAVAQWFTGAVTVIAANFTFLVVQGFFGIGGFAGGTLRLAVPAIVLGFLLGILVGLGRLAAAPWIRLPATVYVEFFRGVPLVMVIFWFWFIIPQLLGIRIPEYGVALTAFVIFEAAYFGEIVRAGVQSVARGQVEAARALGLSGSQAMRFVILPQALRNMTPSLVTQMIVLFKDTSLASIIGYVDLTKAAQIVNNREIRPFPIYLFIAAVYWVCTYSMSRYARYLEKRMGPA